MTSDAEDGGSVTRHIRRRTNCLRCGHTNATSSSSSGRVENCASNLSVVGMLTSRSRGGGGWAWLTALRNPSHQLRRHAQLSCSSRPLITAALRAPLSRWSAGVTVKCLLHEKSAPLLCCRLLLYDEFMKRLLTFAQKCINCDNNLVNFVVRYAIWYGRMASPLGCSVFQCCSKYDFEYEDFMSLSHQYIH